MFENDVDVKTELRWNIKLCPCTFLFTHVRSHQGDDVSIDELPLSQQLNRRVDELAGSFLTNASCTGEKNYMVPFLAAQRISFRTPFNRLVYRIPSKINEYKDGHDTEKLISTNWGLDRKTLEIIDWLPFERAVMKMKREKGIYVLKRYMINGIRNIGVINGDNQTLVCARFVSFTLRQLLTFYNAHRKQQCLSDQVKYWNPEQCSKSLRRAQY